IDAAGGIVAPGMINLHNHLPMVAFRGLAERGITSVEQRLFDYFFPLEKNLLDRELIRVSARHAAMEMALGGVTTTTDMYYHEDEVAAAVKEVGLRGVLGETVIGFPVVDAAEPWGGLAYARDYIEAWRDDPLITPAVAPHAPYTAPPDILRKARALADELDAPILIHMAEIPDEAVLIEETFPNTIGARSVVEYLDDIGFLGPRVLSAHTIYVSPSDIATLKARGVSVAHNPKANSKDMSGTSPAWDMYAAGLAIGLGTDGPMSSNQLDILSVMQHAARVSRIANNDISKFDPAELVEMATLGGARALKREDELGSLEAGKLADIIIVETDSPNMQPNYDPYATLVFAAYPTNVVLTMVHGRVIMRDRTILTVDLEAHAAEWARVTDRVAGFAAQAGLTAPDAAP
ncbi:MAG: amidohydrolase, partial [Caulobacterales bacterium]|nr:amidohydrolase [Caulobacterales bacterium]